jgi:hypothetical protein
LQATEGWSPCAHRNGMNVRDLAAHLARVLHLRLPSRSEGAGKTGRLPHPRSRVPVCAWQKLHTSIQVRREHPGLPCAMVLRLISCSPRRTAVLPPSPALLIADLMPAPRHRDHTTSPYTSGASVHRAICVHRIPLRVRDDGQRPSSCRETSGVMPLICVGTKAEYF